MTQVSAILATSTSLIADKKDSLLSNPLYWTIIAFLVVAIVGAFILKDRERKAEVIVNDTRWSWSGLIYTFSFILVVLAYVLGTISAGLTDTERARDSSVNISQHVNEKYGVTVSDSSDIPLSIKEKELSTAIAPQLIPATNVNGEQIQVTLELTDDGTDVRAFALGDELEKINQ